MLHVLVIIYLQVLVCYEWPLFVVYWFSLVCYYCFDFNRVFGGWVLVVEIVLCVAVVFGCINVGLVML